MTFTPELALAYVRELSADYRTGAILEEDGTLLAGDESLARATRENALLDSAGGAGAPAAFEGATIRGKVFAARTRTQLIVITTSPHALPRVVHRDLSTALAAMGAETAQEMPLQRIPHGAVEAFLRASD